MQTGDGTASRWDFFHECNVLVNRNLMLCESVLNQGWGSNVPLDAIESGESCEDHAGCVLLIFGEGVP